MLILMTVPEGYFGPQYRESGHCGRGSQPNPARRWVEDPRSGEDESV